MMTDAAAQMATPTKGTNGTKCSAGGNDEAMTKYWIGGFLYMKWHPRESRGMKNGVKVRCLAAAPVACFGNQSSYLRTGLMSSGGWLTSLGLWMSTLSWSGRSWMAAPQRTLSVHDDDNAGRASSGTCISPSHNKDPGPELSSCNALSGGRGCLNSIIAMYTWSTQGQQPLKRLSPSSSCRSPNMPPM